MPSTRPALQNRKLIIGLVIAVALIAWYVWTAVRDDGPGPGLAWGNGRIEATEFAIATKLGGRVDDILVQEGDYVQAGQILARMHNEALQAQYDEATAMHQESLHGIAAAQAQVALRHSDVAAAQAVVIQREVELEAARKRQTRSETLSRQGATPQQELDDDRTRTRSAEAGLAASQAQVSAAQAAVTAAQAQEIGAVSRAQALQSTMKRIAADVADSELKAPRDGRVQFRVSQPGEVLGAGGRVLSVVDLTDVYMTFFLPETVAGRVALGSDVRIVLDAAPQYVIPAKLSFVASTAQFTPKTVETASERQKLMFRVRAQLPPELLLEHIDRVKTGLPGVAWVKYDDAVPWPDALTLPAAK